MKEIYERWNWVSERLGFSRERGKKIMDYELWMMDGGYKTNVLQIAGGSFVVRLRLSPQDDR